MDDNKDELVCPITLERCHDPVLATDGHIYERKAITQWIEQNGTSPFTRQILHVEDLRADDHLKLNLVSQGISITPSIDQAKISSVNHLSRKNHSATVHPHESVELEHTIVRYTDCEKQSWVVAFLIIITIGGILCLSILLSITNRSPNKTYKSPSSMLTKFIVYNSFISSIADKSISCPSKPQVTILLQLVNSTQFNYRYYSYLYQAISSNDRISFSFRHSLSYWCLDDLSVININSKVNLIRNGGFENGIVKPFYFCSKQKYILQNILPGKSNQHFGIYAFCYRPIFNVKYLIQNLDTIEGQMYNISFWIKNRSGSINQLKVAMIS